MSEPWTPGPWVANIEQVHKFGPEEDQPGYLHVALIAEASAEEDARLISLAPEMAAVLSLLVECWKPFEESGLIMTPRQITDLAEDVLSRARGEDALG